MIRKHIKAFDIGECHQDYEWCMESEVRKLESLVNEMAEAMEEIYEKTLTNRTKDPVKIIAYQKVKTALQKLDKYNRGE